MTVWIEVADGDRAWNEKIQKNPEIPKRGLWAPAIPRHYAFFRRVRPDDILLTYLTCNESTRMMWRSSIVGISTISNEMYKKGNKMFIDTKDDVTLPIPIQLREFKKVETFSPAGGLKRLIKRSMQQYLADVSKNDLMILLKIHPENYSFLKESNYDGLFD